SQQEPTTSTQAPPVSPPSAPPSIVSPVQEARDLVEVLEARLSIKQAELRECEVHLAQAKRRLAAIERIQNFDYQQALDRLHWAEGMRKKGYYTDGQLRADRQRAEQLNPNTGDTKAAEAPKP